MPTDISDKTRLFTESVIREMTRRALKCGAVNLAQGFPDFAAPAATQGSGQARDRRGIQPVRDHARLAELPRARSPTRCAPTTASQCDPDRNVTVTCGATEAMVATMLAVINPGDEVIIFEPFYENYGPDVILAGATARYVALREPDFSIDRARARSGVRSAHQGDRHQHAAQSLRARSSPAPSWRLIAALCQRHDTLAITDEIYEHIIYGGARHVSIASLPGMARAHHHDQRAVEDLLDHRMAAGLRDRVRAADRRRFARCTIF